jgi:hypothetical protein
VATLPELQRMLSIAPETAYALYVLAIYVNAIFRMVAEISQDGP